MLELKKTEELNFKSCIIQVVNDKNSIDKRLEPFQSEASKNALAEKAPISALTPTVFQGVALSNPSKGYQNLEYLRVAGNSFNKGLNQGKHQKATVFGDDKNAVLALLEGLVLGNYQFNKYFTEPKNNSLQEIDVVCEGLNQSDLDELVNVATAVSAAKTLVNEPQNFLTATQLADEAKNLGKEAGFKVETFNKQKIESLKMGGLLAVNKGSIQPPTFNILEYKPEGAKNEKPIVFVGKGVVYDTGGLSLKPTPNSMDFMKSDMGGAAAVIGALYAIAKNKLNVWVVGLVPATDNRPSGEAYAPGDVIKMFNGKTVEVLNTDAEGRMILADALTYAIKYNPELVIDLATLTGAASRTVGTHAIVSMGTANNETHGKLKESGFNVYERLAELPFWDEYWDMLKSDIADVKNIGGVTAGSITAGKFLELFTKNEKGEHAYPWIHLDIAGPAFLDREDAYRGKNGSGVGVRLLYDFVKQNFA